MPPLPSPPPDRPSTTDAPVVRVRTMPTLTGTWPGRAVLIGGLVKLTAIALSRAVGDSFAHRRGRHGGHARAADRPRVFHRPADRAREAPAALARPPQADPQLHLRRPRAGAAHHHFLPALRPAALRHREPVRRRHAAQERRRPGAVSRAVDGDGARAPAARTTRRGRSSHRKQALLAERYPDASLAIVPVGRTCDRPSPAVSRAGSSRRERSPRGRGPHLEPPAVIPRLDAVRAALPGWWPTRSTRRPRRRMPRPAAIAPGSRHIWSCARRRLPRARRRASRSCSTCPSTSTRRARLREDTGIELRGISIAVRGGASPAGTREPARARCSWADSEDAEPVQAAVGRVHRVRRLGDRTPRHGDDVDRDEHRRDLQPAVAARSCGEGMSFGQMRSSFVLIVVGVLFLIIQFVALVVGLALARVDHRIGARAVRRHRARPAGDFSHRIEVKARDQLGELANSFNTMTSRLTALLAEMAEKKRLEEELRIARDIQMSLLPQGPMRMPGLQMTAQLFAGARGGRRLLRLPADRRPAHRHADRRRLGQGHLGGALHGGAEGSDAVAQPDPHARRAS